VSKNAQLERKAKTRRGMLCCQADVAASEVRSDQEEKKNETTFLLDQNLLSALNGYEICRYEYFAADLVAERRGKNHT